MPEALEIISLIPTWARAYGVSEDAIRRQIPYAYGWCVSNPRKAPKKDVVRFLFNWMKNAKRYGNLVEEKPVPTNGAMPEPEPDMTYAEMVMIREKNFTRTR